MVPPGTWKGHYRFCDLYTLLLQSLMSQLSDLQARTGGCQSELVNTTPSSQVSWSDKYWICRPSKLTYLCKAKEWCIKFFPQVQILDLIFTIEHNLLRPIKSWKCRKKPHCISGQNPDTFRRRSNFPFDTLQVLILLWLKSDLLSLCLPMGMHLW